MIKKIFIFFFIIFTTPINSQEKLVNLLKDGNKLIFIRHAYAPGNGDPADFKLDDCSKQRNLNHEGVKQSKKIGKFFLEKDIIFLVSFVSIIFFKFLSSSFIIAIP